MPWDRTRPKSSEYGTAHAKARKAAAARHSPGDPCTRCGHALGPMRPGLHLDHSDDRTHYLGFAHGDACPVCRRKCNVRAAALKANARRKGQRMHVDYTPRLRW